ncbi:hypothetical protein AeMF1_007087 [Aphanomyces euteiches]|nr:hypothetical protein AeMF1_007102 [Aphanomyces euteiches]KAH9120985.1 hypothetical protein AeMF1_007087 [Aphanomyces euteiches]KAH9191622.1 hypothetical protein AeNC1_006398 [Aphanomyces euteiches]
MDNDADPRLIEYFFVATKTATSHSIIFQYPPQNYDHDEYPQSILLFLFPSRSANAPPAMYNAFVLTTATGTTLHGASFCIFSSTSNNHSDTTTLTSICFVTKYSLYTPFLKYLEQLAVLGTRQHRWNEAHPDNPVHFVEQCLINILHEVSVPRQGSAGVLCSVAGTEVLLPSTALDWEFIEYTFQLVDADNLVTLLHHVLLEHSILIIGSDNVFITAVAETLRRLIAPLQWDHVFIPVIPHGIDIHTLLDAPVPFIAGAHVSQVAHPASLASPTSVVRFDLRENRLYGSHKLLPELPEAAESLISKITEAHAEAGQLPRQLHDRRTIMHQRLRGLTSHKTEASYFLTPLTLLRRKMVKLIRGVVMEYLDASGKKFVVSRPSQDKSFFAAWNETSAYQQYFAQGSSTMSPRNNIADDDQVGAKVEPPHIALRPLFTSEMAIFVDSLESESETAEFPVLAMDAISSPRSRLPYDVPEVSAAKPDSTKKPNSTVVEWLDNWLHGGKLDKAPPAIFHRAKTIGSHLSPRLQFHRSKTAADLPVHTWLQAPLGCSNVACNQTIAECTQRLDEAWIAKKPAQLEQAYVDLIHAFGVCSDAPHREDLDAVWATCLGQNPLPSIFNQKGLWRPFSWLVKTWIDQGDIVTAITWLAQIQIHKAVTTSPRSRISNAMAIESTSSMGLATCVEAELEPLVYRVYTTFGIGSLGMVLQPFNDKAGCQVSGFQHRDENCRVEQDDVLETIDGKSVLLLPFDDIVHHLMDAPRPLTLSFLRGLNIVEDVFQSNSIVPLRPRRQLHDRFGELFERGIRITLLSDCAACGYRISEAELQQHFRAACPICHEAFSPYFCVRCRGQPPSPPIPYFSWSYLHSRVTSGSGTSETSPMFLHEWFIKDPHVYWNIVVKCLALDCPLDSFLIEVDYEEPSTMELTDVQQLCHFVLGMQSENDGLAACQVLARQLLQGDKPDDKLSKKERVDRMESMATTASSVDEP